MIRFQLLHHQSFATGRFSALADVSVDSAYLHRSQRVGCDTGTVLSLIVDIRLVNRPECTHTLDVAVKT